jgi:2-polyprenyl-3-methyl-5-hydroxy-6-metoxy-1,4-benzoquinol methylase
MPLGTTVRSALGPFEGRVAKRYRDWFIDLPELARDIAALGQFQRVLEIGAGDGLLSTGLADELPQASVLGIDISARPGRLAPAAPERVTFRQVSTSDLLAEAPAPYDLIVIGDVLHHVPDDQRQALLADAGRLVASGGVLAIKEWERTRSASHAMADISDRYVTGDRQVSFMTRAELLALVHRSVGDLSLMAEFRIPPRPNNLLVAFRAGQA